MNVLEVFLRNLTVNFSWLYWTIAAQTAPANGWNRCMTPASLFILPKKPLTIEENWHRVVTIPKNEFITLIGHDDILDPHYLSVMDKLIARHPKASLYQTHFRKIDP